MESRAIVAALLMAVLLIVYQMYFLGPGEPPKPPPKEPQAQAPPVTTPAPPATQAASPPEDKPAPRAPRPPQRLATVEGPRFTVVVSSEGGKLQEFNLKYRGDKPMVIVGALGPTGLALELGGEREIVALEFATEKLTLSPERPKGELLMSGEDRGLRVTQRQRFDANSYAIDVVVRIENPGRSPRTVGVSLPWAARQTWQGEAERFSGQHPTEVLWQVNGHIQRIEDLTAVGQHTVNGQWIGMGSIWYLTALIPKTPGFQLQAHAEPPRKNDQGPPAKTVIASVATPTIPPGQVWEGQVVMYVGPKELDRLEALGLEGSINFGGFPVPRDWGGLPMEWLGMPILRLMNWVHDRLVPNYGVAIIILTLISKIIFFPLTVMSLRSMKAMQALGPQMNALRSKYKSDPQRLQRETMALYREHKVNPLGGCLPMVAQVPIFYALYLALSVSVDLQNAPFMCFGRAPSWLPLLGGQALWVCDLAGPDPTFILPILMGVSMFVQQKMTPVMGDPRQAKMMLMMPFIFTFFFFNVASGLVLYWFFSNVLQILQQMYMNRPASPKGAGREVKHAARA